MNWYLVALGSGAALVSGIVIGLLLEWMESATRHLEMRPPHAAGTPPAAERVTVGRTKPDRVKLRSAS